MVLQRALIRGAFFMLKKDVKHWPGIGELNVKIGFDSTGFQNGISSLNREMRKVQSEFKLASAEMGKHGEEPDVLKLKSESLSQQTELQRQKVEALEAAHQKSAATKGTDAKTTADLEIRLHLPWGRSFWQVAQFS